MQRKQFADHAIDTHLQHLASCESNLTVWQVLMNAEDAQRDYINNTVVAWSKDLPLQSKHWLTILFASCGFDASASKQSTLLRFMHVSATAQWASYLWSSKVISRLDSSLLSDFRFTLPRGPTEVTTPNKSTPACMQQLCWHDGLVIKPQRSPELHEPACSNWMAFRHCHGDFMGTHFSEHVNWDHLASCCKLSFFWALR